MAGATPARYPRRMHLDRLFARALAGALAVAATAACTSQSDSSIGLSYPPECSQTARYTVAFDGSIEDGDPNDPRTIYPYCLTVCADARRRWLHARLCLSAGLRLFSRRCRHDAMRSRLRLPGGRRAAT